MRHSAHSRLVLTHFGKVAVADQPGRFLFAFLVGVGQLEQVLPHLLLEIGAEQHEVLPCRASAKLPDMIEVNGLSAYPVICRTLLRGNPGGDVRQRLIVSRYGGYLPINTDDNPFPVSIHNH